MTNYRTDRKSRNKGFTLAELVIVMALLAVVTVMIVSFSVLMSKQVGDNTARSSFLDSVVTLKSDLTNKLSTIDEKGATITVTVDNTAKELTFISNKADNKAENKFTYSFTDLKHVDEINLEIIEGADNTAPLLKIIVISTELNITQTFTLPSRTAAEFAVSIR